MTQVCLCLDTFKRIMRAARKGGFRGKHPKLTQRVTEFGEEKVDSMGRSLRSLAKRKSKRRFSRKQLAAQRLFAKRARAGTLRTDKSVTSRTLRKRRRRGTR